MRGRQALFPIAGEAGPPPQKNIESVEELDIQGQPESEPPPPGTPESRRWWRWKHLTDAHRALVEAPPEKKLRLANTALVLALGAILDELDPGRAKMAITATNIPAEERTFSFGLNGKEYYFTALEFPEYGDMTDALASYLKEAERNRESPPAPALNPELERQISFRIEQAFSFIGEPPK